VNWLLTGPLSRRAVLRYKVAVGLLRTLLSAVLVGLLFRRGLASRSLPFVLATWAGFAVVWLHAAFASLVRVQWQASGRSGPRRALLAVLLIGGLAGVVLVGLRQAGPLPPFEARTFSELLGGELTTWFERWTAVPAVALLLLPARAFFDAVLPRTPEEALAGLLVLGVLLVLALGSVLLLDVPFEEAALASAERRARLETRRRRRGLPLPRLSRAPVLGSRGAPELALTWKNWLALRRVYGARLGFLLVPIALGLGFSVWGALQKGGRSGVDLAFLAAVLPAGYAGLTVFFGPMSFRTDLRSDLRRLDVLRALPLSGAQVVRGELLAPLLLLGGSEVALLLLALGLSTTSRIHGFGLGARAAWTAGLMLLLPAATAAVLVVHNAAALVFPSLLVDDEELAPRGVEAAGTRLLSLGATLLLLVVGFLPAAVVGLLAAVATYLVGLPVLAPAVGGAAAAAVLAGELLLAIRWMGRGLEGLDPTTA
jgi:ABC-2 type transport system permease protein